MSDNYQGGQYPLQPQGNGLGVASLVLGILSIVFGLIPVIGLISWILAPVGLVLGLVALGKPTGRNMTIGGLVTSGIGLMICILWVVGLGALMTTSATVGY
ncbi:hypothetical protein BrevBR_03305 [Brevundimonas sp. BR2-1]|uniref:hypothetical protein n=1 Tax=unclassified Brevundimonas TaxID=2622653 RepID=UPI002FCCADD2